MYVTTYKKPRPLRYILLRMRRLGFNGEVAIMSARGESRLFLGVDVGTGSARAALFTEEGERLGSIARREIKTWTNPGIPEGSFDQSTEDIWQAVCAAVKEVCGEVSVRLGRRVVGVGFAATCSLAVVDSRGLPVTASPSREPHRNVVLWQDHRAVSETNEINSTHHPVLRFVGGALSPEMQPPKLLWLKRHLRQECWEKAGHFFDLADYLTFRATGVSSRSLCCVVCKWSYVGHCPEPSASSNLVQGWNNSFWEGAGLGDLVADGYCRIGTKVLAPGQAVGKGLTQQSANEMGLHPGTTVATSLIDAHAGGVGMLGADLGAMNGRKSCHVTSRLALIGGTSTCHMVVSSAAQYVSGVWGPYYSAMLPGYYLNEGGQSTAGQLLEYVLNSNSALYSSLQAQASLNHCSVYEEINHILRDSSQHLPHLSLLTSHLHVIPDFHGNRSPLADPTILGMVSGLSMIHTTADLAVYYLAVVQALAFGTRHIIEAMNTSGHSVQEILICGGLRQNSLYVQLHADITGLPVVLPAEEEAVLLGSAILAAAAAAATEEGGGESEIPAAMRRMTRVSDEQDAIVRPCTVPAVREYYDKKYRVFLEMYRDQQKYATIMK